MKKLLIERNHVTTLNEMYPDQKGIPIIAGPCSIESYQQMKMIADSLVKYNLHYIRGGAYKPRTSPYDFQGLGMEGLKILKEISNEYNLISVAEVMDARDIELAIEYVDIIQVGSRNMANFTLLSELGKTNKPILLKRGLMSTFYEFIHAAEYILKEGNDKIIMCERGIRTFETETRNTLDLSCVAMLKSKTNVSVIVDLSHSLGRKDILIPMARASLAAGADGLMVEVHQNPPMALSDREQQLNLEEFASFMTMNKVIY